MPVSRPSVTVGFYMRERFSATGESLRSIVKNTTMPYTLVIVDCGAPAQVRAEMEEAVKGMTNVQWINVDHFLYVNQSRNLVANATNDDYVCFIENAATVVPGWLEAFVDACESFPAGAAMPKMMEVRPGTEPIPHHERTFMHLDVVTKDGVTMRRGRPDDALRAERWRSTEVHRVETVEGHCNFISRAALKAMGPFDETLVLGTHVDITCNLQDKGIVTVFVPGAVVTHLPIERLAEYDKAFHLFRCDVPKAKASRDAIVKKWNLRGMADFGRFTQEQHLLHRHPIYWKMSKYTSIPYRIANRLGLTAYKK